MIIEYASKHRWRKNIDTDPFEGFGKNTKTRLCQTLDRVPKSEITHLLQPLTKELLDSFYPLYIEAMGLKDNPKIFNLEERTLDTTNSERKFLYFSLYDQDKLLGGTIISETANLLSVAFRAYKKKWYGTQFPASPAIYAEYLFTEHAISLGRKVISHGKDRNPYGPNASIGLAIFKLYIGCQPMKAKADEYELSTIDTDKLTEDTLVFKYPGENTELITKAYLITSKENEAKWIQVTKYPKLLEVETIYRA